MADKVKLPIDRIRIGTYCAEEILSDQGQVLIGRGVQLTQELVDRLKSRSVTHLNVSEQDFRSLSGQATGDNEGHQPSVTGDMPKRPVVRTQEAYSPERKERFTKTLDHTLGLIESLAAELMMSSTKNIEQIAEMPRTFEQMLFEDSDQSISATNSSDGVSLAARTSKLTMMSMAIGIEMGLPEQDIFMLGTAALLHDLGLYLMPDHFRDPSRTLTYDEAEQYKKHPEIAADILAGSSIASEELRVLILQVHELADGSGYPRGLKKNRLHRLTSILSLAEIYVALTHCGQGRPPLAAYDAIYFLLFQCSQGLVDSTALRALINQISLYGIGSLVKVSDGSTAAVLRRDADHFDKPVIEVEEGGASRRIRLSESHLSISAPHRLQKQMQLDRETTQSLFFSDLLFL